LEKEIDLVSFHVVVEVDGVGVSWGGDGALTCRGSTITAFRAGTSSDKADRRTGLSFQGSHGICGFGVHFSLRCGCGFFAFRSPLLAAGDGLRGDEVDVGAMAV
jgi:hypothetical protein